MPFPLWITNKISLDIDELGISSEKYLINHIDDYLGKLDLILIKKTDNMLIFHYGIVVIPWKRGCLIGNGLIKITTSNDKVIIKIKSLTAGMFLIASVVSLFFIFDNPPIYEAAIFFMCGLFGLNYIVRFVAHKFLKRDIKNLIMNL